MAARKPLRNQARTAIEPARDLTPTATIQPAQLTPEVNHTVARTLARWAVAVLLAARRTA
jgi:hypothetical protein